MKESKFTKELRQSIALKWPGSTTLKIPGNAMNAGLPDLVAIMGGTTVFIEAKCYSKPPVKPFRIMAKVSERQKATLMAITRAKGEAFVIIRFSQLLAVILNWELFVELGDHENARLDPAAFRDADPGQRREAFFAISQRHSGGVWDNLEFLTW
jgi:Holliday junction resolvase